MKYSDKIRNIRRKNLLSQEEFAERLGVSRQAVHKWETGQSFPDAEKLLLISREFQVSIDYLLKDEMVEEDAGQTGMGSKWKASAKRKAAAYLLAAFDCLAYGVLWIITKVYPQESQYLELDMAGELVRHLDGVAGLVYNRDLFGLIWLMGAAAVLSVVLLLWDYVKKGTVPLVDPGVFADTEEFVFPDEEETKKKV